MEPKLYHLPECKNNSEPIRAGIHILLGENFEEIVSSPTGSVTFGSNTDFGTLISAWEVESQAARDGQLVLRLAFTRPTVVLIQDPVN